MCHVTPLTCVLQELRADNDVLGEARLKMADQLKLSQKRVDSLIADLGHAQTSLDEVNCVSDRT